MTIAKEIITELNVSLIKDKLKHFPETIFKHKNKVRTCREANNEAESNRATREAELICEIASETNPATGKAAFSNAESRQAELRKRRDRDAEYQDCVREKKQTEMALNQAEDELEKVQNEYKSWLFVSDLVSDEIALYAGIAKRDVVREEIREFLKTAEQRACGLRPTG